MQASNGTIFGMIAVSLDVGIVNVFVFHTTFERVCIPNTCVFGHCVNFSGKKVPPLLVPVEVNCLPLVVIRLFSKKCILVFLFAFQLRQFSSVSTW